MKGPDCQPIFEFTRGPLVESVHFGAYAVVSSRGELLASLGNAQAMTFLRSAAKPFQALPLVEQGGAENFGLDSAEIALMCGSHTGTDAHVSVACSIQHKAGFTEADLSCGVHPPMDQAARQALEAMGRAPSPNQHNCSGKHSGMLALARHNHWDLENYLEFGHPVQQSILVTFAEMCGLEAGDVQVGTDGCSAPNFAVPLFHAALGYARLVDFEGLSTRRARACRTLRRAMMDHPEMVAGAGEFDTCLMQTAPGKLISKGGAQGFQGVGILPQALGPGSPGIGIAVKISDGNTRNVRSAVVMQILVQLGALSIQEVEQLGTFGPVFPLFNWRKIEVGEGRPSF